MAKYIIDGELYNCSKSEALATAYTNGIGHVFIIGKSNHWKFDGGRWFLAFGGNDCNDPYAPASIDANQV